MWFIIITKTYIKDHIDKIQKPIKNNQTFRNELWLMNFFQSMVCMFVLSNAIINIQEFNNRCIMNNASECKKKGDGQRKTLVC